jgi:hypothetical protein
VVEAALNRDELSVDVFVFELDAPLPLDDCQRLGVEITTKDPWKSG